MSEADIVEEIGLGSGKIQALSHIIKKFGPQPALNLAKVSLEPGEWRYIKMDSPNRPRFDLSSKYQDGSIIM